MKRMLAAFIAIMTMAACEDKLALDPKKVNHIEYAFHDSSVPPPYHRSYNVKVEPDFIRLSVDSYGDILVDTTFENTTEAFQQLIELINNSKLISGENKSEPGCTGGTSEELIIFEDDKKVYAGYFENCGGNKASKIFGDYESVISAIKEMVPNLSTYLK